MSENKPTLTDIPNEVVLEHLLPALHVKDLNSLSIVNHHFNELTSDSTFWRNKTLRDFTFPSTSHPVSTSTSNEAEKEQQHPGDGGWWKKVYFGLLNPKAYLWGSAAENRLGGAQLKSRGNYSNFVDLPSEIDLNLSDSVSQQEAKGWTGQIKDSLITALTGPGSIDKNTQDTEKEGDGNDNPGVVELQAGGWSFTARKSDGSVWVWGQMEGPRSVFRIASWQEKNFSCKTPTKLPLPCKAESISAGRRHLLVLDSDNLIWELTAWGKAYHHTSSELTSPSGHGITHSPPHIVQLSAGWNHSAALTSKGEIHLWYPFSDTYENALTNNKELSGPLGNPGEKLQETGLKYGKVGENVLMTLPPVPPRISFRSNLAILLEKGRKVDDTENTPERRQQLQAEDAERQERELSKPTSLLEEERKVIKIASGEDFIVALRKNGEVWLTEVKEGQIPNWQFMQFFSSDQITHITAQFRSFVTYDTPTSSKRGSSVHVAELPQSLENIGENVYPSAFDFLNDKGIIQVAIGDYHYAALNDKGEMFTWGQGDAGQLGRSQVRSSKQPSKVFFPDNPNAFVFSITAAGWHTGALVLGNNSPSEEGIPRADSELSKDVQTGTQQRDEEEYRHQWPRSLFNPYGENTIPVPPSNNNGGGPVRAMPFFRVGFAGRGANIGAGRGNHSNTSQIEEEQQQGQGQIPGGVRSGGSIFRVGFAGRGANTAVGRGRGGGSGSTQGGGNPDAPW
ncbi:uncharacterized protein L201_004820 [Kwoniella dendrophila CBS 6074]|uniref:SCF-associated factor 1 n=1 Tax=Kwoniella dendrophila CBS 6074 TaxID=1295534 RepID=A0AAX4JWS4_9TREE